MTESQCVNVQTNHVPGAVASQKNAALSNAALSNAPLRTTLKASAAFIGAAVLVACGGTDTVSGPAANSKPTFLKAVTQTSYDGISDDLLTAGLGKAGLAGLLPAFADPLKPSAVELRRAAVYSNYRALLDMTAAGGYGTLYGPNVDSAGAVGTGEGRIAGIEYIAYSDDGTGSKNVTLMVQVPASFNKANPCIITATASGSRGVYGGISTGEWGLKRGCAVAYSDKGTGAAPHDLAADTVPLIDGSRASATTAGSNAAFRANLSSAELASFNAATPNRFAFKHAHSQQNPEADWGRSTLQAVEFAYWVINETFGDKDASGTRLKTLTPANTIVIASSISNGGGAAIAAAEQDTQGLISGVAVSEPAVELPLNPGVSVKRGGTTLEPQLATSWQVSTDAKTFAFTLRRGVRFHSTAYFTPTREFNADDVMFTFTRFIDPKQPFNLAFPATFVYPQSLGLAGMIDGIDRVDDYTVRFTSRRRTSPS